MGNARKTARTGDPEKLIDATKNDRNEAATTVFCF